MRKNDEGRMMKEEVRPTIKFFTDLDVWQAGHALVLEVYLLSKLFPAQEQYGLSSQIKRAVVSITSNIAEGFKRDTMKDKLHFYIIAHGSLSEVQNQLYVARDVQYVDVDSFEKAYRQTEIVDRLLSGFIRASKERLR